MHMQHKIDPEDALRLPSFRGLYALTILLGALIGAHLVLAAFGYTGPDRPFGWVDLAFAAAVIGGARIVYGALLALFEGNVGADLALAIALLASLILGEYWVGAEVVFIAMVGESLEALTFARTHREMSRILELQPRVAHVLRDGHEVDVPITELNVGERVVVRPGERVPIDGAVLGGQSAVDQSTLTGESVPVDKAAGDLVFAGTLNQFGALEVRADKVGEDTTLAQVIELVAEAQENKAPIERIADRLARVFLPVVLASAAGTMIYTTWGTPWSNLTSADWMPTLAVLVVACPCALILATPAAIMAALAWLARRGVLIKGGVALERLAHVRAIAFDKTGTLTEGKLQLGDVIPLAGRSADEVLAIAAAAESRSEHLLGRLIVAEAAKRALVLPSADEFTAHPGAGVVARTSGPWSAVGDQQSAVSNSQSLICVGNRRLLEQQGVKLDEDVAAALARLDAAGQTPLAVAVDGRVIGLVGARDTIRADAADVLHELRHLGIDEIVLLTGDRRPAAEAVARAVGIDEFHAELLPQEKAEWIKRRVEGRGSRIEDRGSRSVTSQSSILDPRSSILNPQRVHIAMIGDGVNDAPALASADVGLALGGVGSDIAAEAGDLVLMGDPLAPLPGLVRLSRATVRVIRQNIVLFAFIVNGVAIVLAAAERLGPVGAAIYHQIGSFLVLVNAMRLLWFERWERSAAGRFESQAGELVRRAGAALDPLLQPVRWAVRKPRAAATCAAAAAVIGYLAMGVTIVDLDEVGVAKRCGGFIAALEPGLHFRLPPPWETVERFAPDRVRVAELGFRTRTDESFEGARPIEWTSTHREGLIERVEDESLLFTGDENLLELNAVVHFSVRRGDADIVRYLFEVRDPDSVVKSLAEGVLRELAARRAFWNILTAERAEIEREARSLLQQRTDDYRLGVDVRAVALQDVHPPLQVVDAFHDVSSAFKDRERMQKEADAYFQQQIITVAGAAAAERLARHDGQVTDAVWAELKANLSGEASSELAVAKARAADQTYRAEGDAAAFSMRRAAYADWPAISSLRLYLNAIEATLADKDKLVLDPAAAGRRQLFLADPEKFNIRLPAAAPVATPPRDEDQ
jgi:Cu+-exporting ATPase